MTSPRAAGYGPSAMNATTRLRFRNACSLAFAALVVSACGPDAELRVVQAGTEPLLGSRTVLRITSRPIHPLGRLNPEAAAAMAKVDAWMPDQGLPALLEHAGSPSARVRDAVLTRLLGLFDDVKTPDAVRQDAALGLLAFVDDPRPALGDAARELIGELTDTTRDTLYDRALRSTEPGVARGAALIWPSLLRNGGSAELRQGRISAVLTEANPEVGFLFVSRHCGELGATTLATLLQSDKVHLLAAATVCELGKVRLDTPTATRLDAAAVAPLEEALDQLDGAALGDVADAVSSLSSLLDESAKKALLPVLDAAATAQSWRVSIAVGEARAALGNPDGLATLGVFIRGSGSDARIRALAAASRVGAIRRIESPPLVTALEAAADDPDAATRTAVAEVLGVTLDGRGAAILARLVRDKSVDVRAAAAYASGRSGNPRTAGALCESAILDESSRVSDAAYASLHHLIHGHPLPPPSMVSEWLDSPGDLGGRPFWGREHVRWRELHQAGLGMGAGD